MSKAVSITCVLRLGIACKIKMQLVMYNYDLVTAFGATGLLVFNMLHSASHAMLERLHTLTNLATFVVACNVSHVWQQRSTAQHMLCNAGHAVSLATHLILVTIMNSRLL